MGTITRYRVFTRNWWRNNPAWPNGLEPHAGRKTYRGCFLSEGEARRFCQQWNATHDPGRLSNKMEYESKRGRL